MGELNQKEVNEQMYLFVKRWLDDLPFEESKKIPFMAIGYCLARLSKQDELLKEQEAVAPEKAHSSSGITWWNVCGICKTAINPNDKYCHECGRTVKWE